MPVRPLGNEPVPNVMTSSPEEMDKDSFLSNNGLTLGFYFLNSNGF